MLTLIAGVILIGLLILLVGAAIFLDDWTARHD